METTQFATDGIDEIVFQFRNKDYGAYDLRKSYINVLNKSFLIGSIGFITALAVPNIMAKYTNIDLGRTYVLSPPITLTPPPPVEEYVPEIPPPAEAPVQSSTKFTIPEITIDDNVLTDDIPPTQTELLTAPAGPETVVGNPDAVVDIIIENQVIKEDIVELKVTEDAPIFVEQVAEYIGGLSAMYKFISANIRYPEQALRANVEGKVYLSFIVNKLGAISDIKVEKGIGFGCDEEAIRVVKLMPNWKPGKQNGVSVKSRFNLPIAFVINQ